jgi:Ca2+/Na+ antiporter
MAMATSCPEMCISCVSVFIQNGDIVIGSIVGSAIFNILVVTACCSFFIYTVTQLDFWTFTRDCIFYGLSVLILIIVIFDHLIMWYEALLMVVSYIIYLTSERFSILIFSFLRKNKYILKIDSFSVMSKGESILEKTKHAVFKTKTNIYFYDESTEITPFFMHQKSLLRYGCIYQEEMEASFNMKTDKCFNDRCITNPWQKPKSLNIFLYIFRWPITFLFWCTIPNCRKFKKFFILTFISCIAWIIIISYLVASLMSDVGK